MNADLSYIQAELESGKFLILHPILYEKAMPMLKKAGFTEEALSNIYKSESIKFKNTGNED